MIVGKKVGWGMAFARFPLLLITVKPFVFGS